MGGDFAVRESTIPSHEPSLLVLSLSSLTRGADEADCGIWIEEDFVEGHAASTSSVLLWVLLMEIVSPTTGTFDVGGKVSMYREGLTTAIS